MAKTIGQALREARSASGKTQRDIAVAVGVSRAAVGQWESDTNAPSTDNLIAVANYLDVPLAALAGASVKEPQPRAPSEVASVLDNPPRFGSAENNVPVLGTAVGGESADFYWNGEVVDYVRRPTAISNAKGVYAVYIAGTSMSPRYEEGEMVYVNPTRPAGIGDYVIVELHPDEANGERSGPGYIKRLVRRTPTTIVTEQFNPPKEIVFSRSEVKQVHRIVPWNELLGF